MDGGTMVECLLKLLSKDQITYEHSLRVGNLAKLISNNLQVSLKSKQNFIIGCLLHDIGKITIPIEILNKQSSLNPGEWEVMKKHPQIGSILSRNQGITDDEILNIIRHHHERMDGAGYPDGLTGNNIPAFAKICSIIDAFDCMVSDRPYRKAMPISNAKKELLNLCGSQFDESYVNLFVSFSDSWIRQATSKEKLKVSYLC